MKTASLVALILAAGTAVAQNDPATALGNTGALGTGDEAFGGARTGNVIYSTLNFLDNQDYNAGNGNAYSGVAVFGGINDLMLADDFVTTNDSLITQVTGDYATFLGANPAGGLQVDIYTDAGGAPGTLVSSSVNAVTGFSTQSDTVFGLIATRITADVSISLDANTSYYIMIQPVDLTNGGDWYYQLRNTGSFNGGDSYGKDGGRGTPGYGTTTWTSMGALGFGVGDAGMEIRALSDSCDADFNGDGVVDTRDVLAFLNAWANGDVSADCDGNGIIDTRDVTCFLNAWVAGC